MLLYNDEWSPIPGEKHPWALGRPAREAWPEIWHIIEPLFNRVMTTGEATRSRDQLLPMHRHGFTEECYFDYTFSPIRGEGGEVEGVFNAVLETTTRVIGERRLRTLRELGAWKTGEARTAEEACKTATHITAQNPLDLPFTLLYLLDGRQATLAGLTGLGRDTAASPAAADLDSADAPWPFRSVAEAGKPVEVDDLPARFGPLPGGAWPESPQRAVVLPMAKSGQTDVAGFVVAGVSPRLRLDDDYRGFLDLLAGHVAAAVANARAYEEERKRAEALAELDRAKTAFFSNVSHEFRTPLTLMLGPVEDMLAKPAERVLTDNRGLLEVVHRNGLRLQRLVNALLDFSRIEAGRVKATYEPTDLAAFTADLASNFRSACERAGLTLTVDCPPLGEPVFVDRQMWEKVVLNLLSNAFKFTLEGGIAVSVRRADHTAVVRVADTGTGIPPDEMPRLFERFHRVENARGRTHEGSGIGLALVQELVKLHCGSINAESEVGERTTFTVTIPVGSAHLPPEQVGGGSPVAAPVGAAAFVEEALRWLPDARLAGRERPPARDPRPSPDQHSGQRPRVLVADDNADMRSYVGRLLGDEYTVEAAADGAAALEAVRRETPDLILSDVMMPRLDGFGLLKELRADPRTAAVPVILLSARAGEESRVEGMRAGADDYLVKPFSARELLVRVAALLHITRLRREAQEAVRQSEERFRLFMNNSPTTAYIKDAEGRYVFVNRTVERQFNRPLAEWVGKTDADLFPPDEARRVRQNDLTVLASRTTAEFEEASTRPDGVRHYLSFKFPLQDRDGGWLVAGMSLDITEQKQAEEARRRLAAIVESSHDAILSLDLDGTITSWNRGAERLYGYGAGEVVGRPVSVLIPPDHTDDFSAIMDRLRRGEQIEHFETVRVARDGRRVDVSLAVSPVLDAGGRVVGASKIARDITDRKRAEADLRESEERLAAELEATTRLHALSSRLLSATDLATALDDVLENAMATCRADFGNIQLLNPQAGALEIVAQRGFRADFLDYFCTVRVDEGSACAQAMQSGGRIMIEDVDLDPSYEPHRKVAAAAGYWAVQSTPLKAHDGAIVGMLSTHFRRPHRTSERDERLLDLYARHAADLIERLRYEQALRDADGRKDEFLATLAHELRNPLAPLRNGLQIMRLSNGERQAVEKARTMMERQLSQMVHLVDDLLDLSRISRGKIELRKERLELARVVQQAVETSRPAIEQAGHDLTITMPSGPVYVDADPTRLAQVYSNLLNNAAKYTDRGGRVELAVRREGGEAVVSVRDNGVGIPTHMLPRVFDIFTQVGRNLERSQGGLGIGLSIVKKLVEMHGGTVEARSDGPGKGSEFVVRLPLVIEASGPAAVAERDEPTTPTSSLRILIVDDNRDGADSLAMLLRIMGNDIRTAYDGQEGVQVAGGFRPDVALFDIGLPKLDGYEACRRIREQSWGKNVVLIAVTGWGQEEDRRRSHEAGFDHHMVKPVDPQELMKLLAGLQAVKA